MIDEPLRGALEAAVGADAVSAAPVRGGDVSVAYRVDLGDGRRVFVKTHRAPSPGFFTTEAFGLSWLREAGALPVPEVLGVSDGGRPPVAGEGGEGPQRAVSGGDVRTGGRDEKPAHGPGAGATGAGGDQRSRAEPASGPPGAAVPGPAFLVLEWVDGGTPVATTEAELGRGLAALHRAGAPSFGREDRRLTGSRGLPNEPLPRWSDFYAENRLRPLARLARDTRALDPGAVAALERVAGRLEELGGTVEPPARLHGDLWAGNRMVGTRGESWLIDPAAHGGHREFDLAMMRLFGGFGSDCFTAYHEAYPLADGWEDRVVLHQIAPLVVHAVKFGGSYVGAAEDAIARYS